MLWMLGACCYVSMSFGQNLIPNPGFENFEVCPPYPGQIHLARSWDNPNNRTTDYLHRCSPPADGAGAPDNLFGTQEPHSGDAYVGLRTWIPVIEGNPVYREYLATELLSPLQANRTYELSFWVSVGEASTHWSDDIGVFLGFRPFEPQSLYRFTPQLRQPEGRLIENEKEWQVIRGTYRAEGGERFLLIGNFLDDSSMTRKPVRSGEPTIYYYIDDVALLPCDTPAQTVFITDTTFCAGDALQLIGIPDANTYQWDDGSRFAEKSIRAAGRYTVTSFFSCYEISQTFEVASLDCGCDWRLPTVWNSRAALPVNPPAQVERVKLRIYDALGRLAYRSESEPPFELFSFGLAGIYFWEMEVHCRGAWRRSVGKLVLVTD